MGKKKVSTKLVAQRKKILAYEEFFETYCSCCEINNKAKRTLDKILNNIYKEAKALSAQQNTACKKKLDEALKLIGELEKAVVLLVDRQDKAEKELKNKGASFTSDMLVRNLKAKITKIKAFKESIYE